MLDFAHKLADIAAKILKKHFRNLRSEDFRMKARMDPVTIADTAVEKALVEALAKEHPDHTILAEEFTDTRTEGGPLWVIDPIDGTNNFLHGIPNTCTSIAYLEDGVVQAAIVDAPFIGERFAAQRGQGATLNGETIKVSTFATLEEAMVCTGYADLRKYGDETNLDVWKTMAPKLSGLRRYGAAALDLCWVACGRFDGFWERSLSPWDVAAGSLIIEEAGGVVVNIGQAPSFNPLNGSLVAANSELAPHLYDAIMAAIANSKGEGEATDDNTTLAELKNEMRHFVSERAWDKFHNPKNVSMSIAIEAAELMEIFQWLDLEKASELINDKEKYQHIKEELADILAYTMSLANFLNIDIASAYRNKMSSNREKYPIKDVYGAWKGA